MRASASCAREGIKREIAEQESATRQNAVGLANAEVEKQRLLDLASLRDISAHKRAEDSLRDLTAQLRQANLRLERLANVDPLTDQLNRRDGEALRRSSCRFVTLADWDGESA